MKKLKPIHPGEILKTEFLEAMGLSQYKLHQGTGIPHMTISNIVNEKTSISPENCLILSKFFGLSERFWLNIQVDYNRRLAKRTAKAKLSKVRNCREFTAT